MSIPWIVDGPPDWIIVGDVYGQKPSLKICRLCKNPNSCAKAGSCMRDVKARKVRNPHPKSSYRPPGSPGRWPS